MNVALVTGCANGLGEAIARHLLREGFSVVGADIDDDQLKVMAGGASGTFHPFTLDVRSLTAWAELESFIVARCGRLDVVVNNAGIVVPGTIETLDVETFRDALAVDLIGPFNGCKLAINLMKTNGGGSIVNIGSRAALRANPDLLAYGAAKAGLTMLTKSVALHCARSRYNIRCNVIHPGLFSTTNNDRIAAKLGAPNEIYDEWSRMIPLGRIGQPDEVASLVSYLVSSASTFVTGAEFTIDGGASL